MSATAEILDLTAPDDWHIHLRDQQVLEQTVADAARGFRRAIVMPNLTPPIVNADQALSYRDRILGQVPDGSAFEPLMTLYLTDNTSAADIVAAQQAGIVACKLYPAGATTNSASGVTAVEHIYPALEAMQKHGLLLLIHGEVTDAAVDIFDREAVFIERILHPLRGKFPQLKIVLEHITTADAVDYVEAAESNLAATITAHHLLLNRNHLLVGGVRPHYYCLPILKRQAHQQALIRAATSGDPRFFLGTDSAPHSRQRKESACGCAGIYTAFAGIELYAQAFEEAGALDRLEAFASHFGADYYGLPRNAQTIRLVREPWQVPETLPLGDDSLVPLLAGQTLNWQLRACG